MFFRKNKVKMFWNDMRVLNDDRTYILGVNYPKFVLFLLKD